MRTIKTKKHRQAYSQKKEEIIRAAEKRFIRHGLQKTTVDEIARDLRIGKATLYHYFKTKEELFRETVLWQSEEYLRQINSLFINENISSVEQVSAYLELKRDFGTKFKLLDYVVKSFLNDSHLPGETEYVVSLLKKEGEIIKVALATWLPKEQEINLELLANTIVILGFTLETADKIFPKLFPENEGKMTETRNYLDLLLRSIILDPPRNLLKYELPSTI